MAGFTRLDSGQHLEHHRAEAQQAGVTGVFDGAPSVLDREVAFAELPVAVGQAR
ncbi:hypothetical protein [Streptomyces sp. NBC_01506]|uniref:hypothetical protein n=1 Tax=Streptomyces sp. NBC_01506 TaxID=2903887 RepID=UPI00386916BB